MFNPDLYDWMAFQVQYLDFYICFIALRVVPREFLWPQVIMFDIMSLKLVHSIRNSLYAKHSAYFMVNFMFLTIGNDLSHSQ